MFEIKENDPIKKGKNVEPLEAEFTGEGYIPYDSLIEAVELWKKRQKLSEDIDYLENKGGIDWLVTNLKTNLKTGLDSNGIQDRIRAYGSNQHTKQTPKGFWLLWIEALYDFTLIILMIAAVVSIIISMIVEVDHRATAWIEGVAILAAVGVSSLVQAVNNYQKEQQFQKLSDEAESKKKVKIIRDGVEADHQLCDCLVGDVLIVESGMEVPGDAILIQGYSVSCDESALTGESDHLEKAALDLCIKKRNEVKNEGRENTADKHEIPSPVLIAGTNVQQGTGTMMIITVGDNSSIGRIKKTIENNKDEETPLQKKLNKIAEDIGKAGLVCAIITFLIMIIRAAIDAADKGKWTNDETSQVVQAFLISITVLVVAIPEGLPLAVTLSLAFSVKKMLNDSNLVRKMHACETMGGADII